MTGRLLIAMNNKINQLSFVKEENLSDSLFEKFESIHNYLYANDGLSEEQVLDEITKILFMKFYDERKSTKRFYISDTDFMNITSKNVQKTFINKMNKLFIDTKNLYDSYFDKRETLKLSLRSIAFSVNKLQNVTLTDSEADENGLAFQKFISRYSREGRGQFFTPDPVVNVCIDIIQPKKNEIIIDPACGTGGFLFSALQYIKKRYKNLDLKSYTQNNLYGIEINPRISQIANMKFLMENNISPNIFCANALNNFESLSLKHNIKLANKFDIVLTNPPFGTKGKITNQELLSQYSLGRKWVKSYDDHKISSHLLKGQAPEILFVERCIQLLKPGGRLGIVLPNGHLENSSLEYLRTYVRANMDILGVVLLPQETFIPYGTGIKTSLLFLQKKKKNLKNYKIFFSQIKKVGYAGTKTKKTIYKNTNGINSIDEDFSEVISDYNMFLKTSTVKSNSSFVIESDRLKGRLDYGYYLPKNRKLIDQLQEQNAVCIYELADIVKIKKVFLNKNKIVNYVELSDVYTKSFEIINSTSMPVNKLPSRASYELKTDDIITSVAGNSIGTYKHATAYVTSEFNNAICTNGFRILRNFKISPFYLLYYFQTSLFLKQVFMYRTGAAIPALSDDDFKNILVYVPPKNEVEKIGSIVKNSFELRQKAKEQMKNIALNKINQPDSTFSMNNF